MPIALKELVAGRVLECQLSGKLVQADYETFVPEVERLVQQHGAINMLVDLHDLHGWTAGAMWADTKFAMHHFHDFGRLAVVGEAKWQQTLAAFCKPFTSAEVRYFDHTQLDTARTWVGAQ